MALTIDAIYDGKVFLPIQQPDIKPDTRVRISVLSQNEEPLSFLKVARSLQLEGPSDWSEKLDEYLYGGKKI